MSEVWLYSVEVYNENIKAVSYTHLFEEAFYACSDEPYAFEFTVRHALSQILIRILRRSVEKLLKGAFTFAWRKVDCLGQCAQGEGLHIVTIQPDDHLF